MMLNYSRVTEFSFYKNSGLLYSPLSNVTSHIVQEVILLVLNTTDVDGKVDNIPGGGHQ